MTTISVENHLHRIQQRWCGQTKREREILVKLYSCGEIEYLHIQHLFHQKCPNLTCSILPPQSIIHTGQLTSHVVTSCNATIFSGLSFLAAFKHIQARIVTQQSTLNTTDCGRKQSTECRVWERGTAKARRCLSRTWARPQACTCFDQVLWKFNYLLMKISIIFLKSITFIKEKFSQIPC